MWGSIATGTLVPIVLLAAVLSSTEFSYRMGQTCLLNHENAVESVWIWFVGFYILDFMLHLITIGYCVATIRKLHRERSNLKPRVVSSTG